MRKQPTSAALACKPEYCPRCKGNVYLDWDVVTGEEWSCLQCGWCLSVNKAYLPRKEKPKKDGRHHGPQR